MTIIVPKLTDDEMTSVTEIIRNNKFDGFSKIVYSFEIHDIFKNFINCYKLLTIVSLEIKDDDTKQKILSYITSLNVIDKKINEYLLDNNVIINLYVYKNKIKNFYIDNHRDIHNLISFSYQFGRVIKLFDPDESQGIY